MPLKILEDTYERTNFINSKRYYINFRKYISAGMVNSESTVEINTDFAASFSSPSHSIENIIALVATGIIRRTITTPNNNESWTKYFTVG